MEIYKRTKKTSYRLIEDESFLSNDSLASWAVMDTIFAAVHTAWDAHAENKTKAA